MARPRPWRTPVPCWQSRSSMCLAQSQPVGNSHYSADVQWAPVACQELGQAAGIALTEEAPGFYGRWESAWARGIERGSLEEVTQAGAGRVKPDAASPRLPPFRPSKVSAYLLRSIRTLKAGQFQFQPSGVGLPWVFPSAQSPGWESHPVRSPQALPTSG